MTLPVSDGGSYDAVASSLAEAAEKRRGLDGIAEDAGLHTLVEWSQHPESDAAPWLDELVHRVLDAGDVRIQDKQCRKIKIVRKFLTRLAGLGTPDGTAFAERVRAAQGSRFTKVLTTGLIITACFAGAAAWSLTQIEGNDMATLPLVLTVLSIFGLPVGLSLVIYGLYGKRNLRKAAE